MEKIDILILVDALVDPLFDELALGRGVADPVWLSAEPDAHSLRGQATE
jgi:hypothetical protein